MNLELDLESMRAKNWRQLIRPKGVSVVEESENYARFVAEPLERGYGHTLGASIKEALLTTIRGSAIIAYKLKGKVSEGKEHLAMNLKELVVWSAEALPQTISGTFQSGPVSLSSFELPEGLEVLEPERLIATVPEGKEITLQLVIGSGFSYVPASDHRDCPKGFTAIDAAFKPIRQVEYQVSEARVGQRTDYNKLNLRIYSNGLVSPRAALMHGAMMLKQQMAALINFEESDEALPEEEQDERLPVFNENLNRRVADLELSVRSSNCLKNANIEYIGDLVQRTEAEMLKTKNFGRKSLQEIQAVLEGMGLTLGMDIEGWQPQPLSER